MCAILQRQCGLCRAGYKDVKGKLYPGMRHEILNEIGREQVYHDIAVYMRKKGF